jgi:hypothetical protein
LGGVFLACEPVLKATSLSGARRAFSFGQRTDPRVRVDDELAPLHVQKKEKRGENAKFRIKDAVNEEEFSLFCVDRRLFSLSLSLSLSPLPLSFSKHNGGGGSYLSK